MKVGTQVGVICPKAVSGEANSNACLIIDPEKHSVKAFWMAGEIVAHAVTLSYSEITKSGGVR